tara:strand:+ start:634 stop:2025 length:1392 start_codon:yes stop_codon:yes gene_type:complete
MDHFIFYDTETSSLRELNFVQAIQIGSILTNSSLKQIDSFSTLCSPLPWTLVTPKALLINKKKEIFDTEITHYQMIKSAYGKWSSWSSSGKAVFISYNGMRFDEEVMRRQFYWNLFDPYITNTNGNARLDLYLKMYVVGYFYRDLFPIPEKNNQISLKLEHFAELFRMNTQNAHDALEDCEYLKELFNQIKSRLPNFYNEIITTTSKQELFDHLIANEVNYLSSYIPSNKTLRSMPFTILAGIEAMNQTIIFNLNNDPKVYFDLTFSELREVIENRSESPFKTIGINRTIPSISAETLKQDKILPSDNDLYLERAKQLRSNPDFIFKVNEIFADKEKPIYQNSYNEEQIYSGGFPNQINKDRMKSFHNAQSLTEKLSIANSFDDERHRDFAIRICAQEYPSEIDIKHLQHCKNLVKLRFSEDGPWPDAKKYLQEGESLLAELTNPDEKKLVKLAINSIKSSRN